MPDGSALEAALGRTTHLGIGAHADDLEILAIDGILRCYQRPDRWFTGVTVSDGAGSVPLAGTKQRELVRLRCAEQREAAQLGGYSAQLQLGFASADVKVASGERHDALVGGLEQILRATRPELVYTHSLADAHDTHVAVALRVIEAARRLPADLRPQRLLGCEVWRDLDWLSPGDKVALPLDHEPGLQARLLEVFRSQLVHKRYDLATLGRRRAHATFGSSHSEDAYTGLIYAMELTPLLDGSRTPAEFSAQLIANLASDVNARLARLGA